MSEVCRNVPVSAAWDMGQDSQKVKKSKGLKSRKWGHGARVRKKYFDP